MTSDDTATLVTSPCGEEVAAEKAVEQETAIELEMADEENVVFTAQAAMEPSPAGAYTRPLFSST